MRMARCNAKISAVEPGRAHAHQYLLWSRNRARCLLHLDALGSYHRRLHGFGHDFILFVNADDAIASLRR
jgi:hypothetical protein